MKEQLSRTNSGLRFSQPTAEEKTQGIVGVFELVDGYLTDEDIDFICNYSESNGEVLLRISGAEMGICLYED